MHMDGCGKINQQGRVTRLPNELERTIRLAGEKREQSIAIGGIVLGRPTRFFRVAILFRHHTPPKGQATVHAIGFVPMPTALQTQKREIALLGKPHAGISVASDETTRL